MGGFLIFVGFITLLIGIISLIKPLHFFRITTRKMGAVVLVSGLVILMVGASIIPVEEEPVTDPRELALEESEEVVEEEEEVEPNSEEAEQELDQRPADTEPGNLEEFALQVVEDEIGNKTNRSDYPDRIIDTNIGRDNVVLHLVSNDNLTVNMIKGGILKDSLKLFEKIYAFEHEDIFVVNLVWYAPLTDQYGNEELGQVIDIGIYDDTAEKINWDNVLFGDLPEIADYYTEHPEFS